MGFAPALASFALASGAGTSIMVPPSHEHDWQVVIVSELGVFSIDHDWQESHEQQGANFPVVLVQVISNDPDDEMITEMRLATDCAAGRIGVVEMWIKSANRGEHHRETQTVRFDFSQEEPDPFDTAVLAFACAAPDTAEPSA